MSNSGTPAATPDEELRHLFLGYRVSQAIYVAAELGIADLLAEGPKSAEELASACGAHAPSLRRVLRLLASEGVFAQDGDGRFALTPMAEALRGDAPGPVRALVLFSAGEAPWRAWTGLLHSVRTGEPAFDHAHGVGLFEHLRRHPEDRDRFDRVMTAQTAPFTRAVAAAYDFTRFGTVVDVGGAHGALALGLLEAYPHLRGIVFDQPEVAEGARRAIGAAGMAGRCEAAGGDFFDAVPAGGDAYLVKFVLHNWDDERAVAILRACRRAMTADGRLLVIELLVPPGDGPSFAKSQDVNMLALAPGGRERSEAEYRALFEAAGFALARTARAQGELHVIEGVPA